MASLTGGHSNTARGTAPAPMHNRNIGRNRQRTMFPCKHRGLGLFCHRCEQAKQLQERADKGILLKWNRKVSPAKAVIQKAGKEDIEAMRKEAARLLAP